MVSVIIPVYKAEKYIRECLESLLRQSYADVEILVVIDGSPDGSAEIARSLAAQDARICVLDQENKGVSAARNLGLEHARGEYVTFIDADDYVAPDYVEYLLKLATEHEAEFALSRNAFTSKDQTDEPADRVYSLEATEAVAFLLSPRVIVGCWNKIYKRDFLEENHLRFSTELFYGEGLQFIVSAAKACNRLAVGSRRVYYYRRNNEASATTAFQIEKLKNGEKSLYVIKDQINMQDRKTSDAWELHYCTFCLGGMTKILASHTKKEYAEDYGRFKRYLRGHYWKLAFSSNVSAYRKMMLFGGYVSPWMMMRLNQARRKRIERASV